MARGDAVYPAKEVANYFLELARRDGVGLTPLQLIKLVYIAHGVHLAHSGEPLIKESVRAWRFGVMLPVLYHEFKQYGNRWIPRTAEVDLPPPGKALADDAPWPRYSRDLVESAWKYYKHFTPTELAWRTSDDDSPWREARRRGERTIGNDAIRREYLIAIGQDQPAAASS